MKKITKIAGIFLLTTALLMGCDNPSNNNPGYGQNQEQESTENPSESTDTGSVEDSDEETPEESSPSTEDQTEETDSPEETPSEDPKEETPSEEEKQPEESTEPSVPETPSDTSTEDKTEETDSPSETPSEDPVEDPKEEQTPSEEEKQPEESTEPSVPETPSDTSTEDKTEETDSSEETPSETPSEDPVEDPKEETPSKEEKQPEEETVEDTVPVLELERLELSASYDASGAFEGYLTKLFGKLDDAKIVNGKKYTIRATGKELTNLNLGENPAVTVQIIDNSEEAGWWKQLGEETAVISKDASGAVTMEATVEISADPTSEPVYLLFIKIEGNPTEYKNGTYIIGADDDEVVPEATNESEAPAENSVVYELDFSKDLPDSWYVSTSDFGSIKDEILTLPLTEAKYDGAFAFVPAGNIDLSEISKIEVVMKLGDDFTFDGTQYEQRIILQAFSSEDAAAKKAKQDFLILDGDIESDAALISELKSDYKTFTGTFAFNPYDGSEDADMTKIRKISINTTKATGKVFIRSIKFVK